MFRVAIALEPPVEKAPEYFRLRGQDGEMDRMLRSFLLSFFRPGSWCS